jgi:hypothetical protein
MSRDAVSAAGEGEVDLADWARTVRRRWWIVACGFAVGGVVGFGFSFGGGSVYQASALVSLGQPTAPGGAILQGFGENPLALTQIAESASVQTQVGEMVHMSASALRGKISVASVGSTTTAAGRATPLISLTVQGVTPAPTEAAANLLATILAEKTTAPYVAAQIVTYERLLSTTNVELDSINKQLATLKRQLASSLTPLNELVVVSEIDNAQQRRGDMADEQATTDQQLAFARNVESTKVITKATATKSTARSRRSSLAIGALIGLVVGVITAIVSDRTSAPAALGRARPA